MILELRAKQGAAKCDQNGKKLKIGNMSDKNCEKRDPKRTTISKNGT